MNYFIHRYGKVLPIQQRLHGSVHVYGCSDDLCRNDKPVYRCVISTAVIRPSVIENIVIGPTIFVDEQVIRVH